MKLSFKVKNVFCHAIMALILEHKMPKSHQMNVFAPDKCPVEAIEAGSAAYLADKCR